MIRFPRTPSTCYTALIRNLEHHLIKMWGSRWPTTQANSPLTCLAHLKYISQERHCPCITTRLERSFTTWQPAGDPIHATTSPPSSGANRPKATHATRFAPASTISGKSCIAEELLKHSLQKVTSSISTLATAHVMSSVSANFSKKAT